MSLLKVIVIHMTFSPNVYILLTTLEAKSIAFFSLYFGDVLLQWVTGKLKSETVLDGDTSAWKIGKETLMQDLEKIWA